MRPVAFLLTIGLSALPLATSTTIRLFNSPHCRGIDLGICADIPADTCCAFQAAPPPFPQGFRSARFTGLEPATIAALLTAQGSNTCGVIDETGAPDESGGVTSICLNADTVAQGAAWSAISTCPREAEKGSATCLRNGGKGDHWDGCKGAKKPEGGHWH